MQEVNVCSLNLQPITYSVPNATLTIKHRYSILVYAILMQMRYAPSRFDENRPVEVSSAVQFLSEPRVRKTSHVSSKCQAAYVVSRYLYEIFYLHLLSETI